VKPVISLPYSQEPDIEPYPESVESSPHIITPYLIHFNIVLPNTPWSSKWSVPFRFPDQNCLCISHVSHAYRMSCNLILLLIKFILFGEEYRLWSSPFVIFSRLLLIPLSYAQMLSSAPCSQTVNMRSSLRVGNELSHPYITTDKRLYNEVI
jgi:hypothetical protein